MTVGQKAAISLLASTLLAAGFAALAYSGLFSVIETRFFDERVKRSVDSSMDGLSASAETYHAQNTARFSTLLSQEYVSRSFLPNQSASDVFERTKAFGLLAQETTGLTGVRFIDQDGKRIHFSTFPGDVVRAETLKIIYRNYGEDGDEPYAELGVAEAEPARLAPLPARRAFAYRFPFVDGFGAYRGSAVFYVSFTGLLERLIQDGRLSLGDDVTAVGYAGILVGTPSWAGPDLLARIANLWAAGPNAEPMTVGAAEASDSYVLFSRRSDAGLLGRLVPSSWFVMPEALRWLLLSAFFITAYLSLFLILNLRQDRLAVLASRIKRFQIELLEEYLERKGDLDLERWKGELESRRGETRDRIRKSAGSLARKRSADVDALIDKSWDEIIAVMTSRGERPGGVDMARFEALLKEALSKGSFVIGTAAAARQTSLPAYIAPAARAETAPEDVEELEELEEFEDGGEAPAVEEAEEAVEELAEVEEAEEAAELEEAAEAVEELAEVEEAEEAAELEEAAEAVEELAEVEEAEEAAELEEAAEAVEELAEVEEAEEAAEFEEAAEAVEELAEVEELEELEEAEPATAEAPKDEEDMEWGSLSAEALALALDDEDELPIIPESLGLELVEETDLSDVIGYLDTRPQVESGLAEDLAMVAVADLAETIEKAAGPDSAADEPMASLVFTSPFEDFPEMNRETAAQLEQALKALPVDGRSEVEEAVAELVSAESREMLESSMDDLLEEVEFDLFLSALDLSGLDGYRDEDGFLELEETAYREPAISEPVEMEYEVDASDGAFSMLSAEDRDRLEELQPFVPEDAEMGELEPLAYSSYRRLGSGFAYRRFEIPGAKVEELPVVADAEPSDAIPLDAADSGEVIVMVDGIFTINKAAFAVPGTEDPELKALADSVLFDHDA